MTDSTSTPGPRSTSFRIGLWVAVIVGIAALLSALIFPLCSYFYRMEAQSFNYRFGRDLYVVLEKYAQNHDGRFPSSLRQLVPQYLTDEALDQLGHLDAKSYHHYEWLYFPGATKTSPPDTFILASPEFDLEMPNARRHVIRVDGKHDFLREQVFRERRPDRFAAQAP